MTDPELLAQFLNGNSRGLEDLVRRHTDFVYAVARRRVGPSHAEDVTQAVFILLVKKARSLQGRATLLGWLHRTACYCSASLQRLERRRRSHEEESAAMRSPIQQSTADDGLDGLDSALQRLDRNQREVILLHYLSQHDIKQTAGLLHISQAAARKRAQRGLEKLRALLREPQPAASVTALAGLLQAQAAMQAPAALAHAGLAAAQASANGTAAGTTLASALAKEALRAMRLTKWMLTTSAAAVVVFSVALALALSTPPQAYTQVLQQVEKTQAMSCDLSWGDKDDKHLSVRGSMLRLESQDGVVTIGDRMTGKWLFIDPKNHTAATMALARQPFDLYALFRDFKDGNEEPLGDMQLNGRKVNGFRVTRTISNGAANHEVPLTIWVDSATNLPVAADSMVSGETMHATNFKWDQPLDEKLFSMAIPEGYKVQDMGGVAADQLKAPPTTQEAAKLVLKAGAGIGDLKFGDDAARVTELLGKPETVTSGIAWEYPSKGLWLTVSPKTGLIIIMAGSKKAHPMFNVNDFPGKLENGLGIGSSREDVENAYGQPDRTQSSGNNLETSSVIVRVPTTPDHNESAGNEIVTLYYDKAYLWFTVQSGTVTQILLNPSPAARDAIRAKATSQPSTTRP